MADEENESKPKEEKPEVKENASSEAKETEEVKEKDTEAKDGTKAAEKSPAKAEERSPQKEKKSPKKEESPQKKKDVEKKEDKDDDDDDDEDEELPPGLLELPLEVEGKREKKKVERLSATMIRSPQEKKKVEIEEGTGKKLGDIPYVEHQLMVNKAIDLKPLHRILFLRIGSNNEIKRNIRQFCGFTHGKDSKEHEKRMTILNKMVTAELKSICLVLGLERGGTKGNLVERVMDFLMKPEDKGLNVKTKSGKRSRSSGGQKKGAKKKRKSKGSAKKGKAEKNDNSIADDSDEDDEDEDKEDEEDEDKEDEEEDEEEEEEEEEESEEEAPKKKKAKVEEKKKAPKKAAKENGKKEKPAKKETKKPPTPKKKAEAELSDSLSEDSDDEPIAKMKKSPPSNDEIKELVKKILDGADLETVTMKTVVKQVYAKYPSFDLSDRKDFIKDTVREVIS